MSKTKATLNSGEEQPYSFDIDTVLFLATFEWEPRLAIQKRMVEVAEVKKCMPLSLAKKVAKELGYKPTKQDAYEPTPEEKKFAEAMTF